MGLSVFKNKPSSFPQLRMLSHIFRQNDSLIQHTPKSSGHSNQNPSFTRQFVSSSLNLLADTLANKQLWCSKVGHKQVMCLCNKTVPSCAKYDNTMVAHLHATAQHVCCYYGTTHDTSGSPWPAGRPKLDHQLHSCRSVTKTAPP